MIPVKTSETLEQAFKHSGREPVVLYKHSATCTLSARAKQEIIKLSEPDDPPVYQITVQTARPLSNEVAKRFNIRHESPQIIVLDNQQVVFHTSHQDVTAEAVRSALSD